MITAYLTDLELRCVAMRVDTDRVVTGAELDALTDMSVDAMLAARAESAESPAGERQRREYQHRQAAYCARSR